MDYRRKADTAEQMTTHTQKLQQLCVSSPFRHASLDAAGASQRRQSVLLVGAVAGAAQAHVDRLAAGVHAADGGEAHAACPAVPAQRALPALGRGAAEGGAPGQAVGGPGGGVDGAGAGGLWTRREGVTSSLNQRSGLKSENVNFALIIITV